MDNLCLQISLEMKIFYVLLHETLSSCLLSVLSLVRAVQSGCIWTLLFPPYLGGIQKFLPLCPGLAKPVTCYSCSLHQNWEINPLGKIYIYLQIQTVSVYFSSSQHTRANSRFSPAKKCGNVCSEGWNKWLAWMWRGNAVAGRDIS